MGEANVIGDMGKGLAMFALARMDLGCGRGNWQLVVGGSLSLNSS